MRRKAHENARQVRSRRTRETARGAIQDEGDVTIGDVVREEKIMRMTSRDVTWCVKRKIMRMTSRGVTWYLKAYAYARQEYRRRMQEVARGVTARTDHQRASGNGNNGNHRVGCVV